MFKAESQLMIFIQQSE